MKFRICEKKKRNPSEHTSAVTKKRAADPRQDESLDLLGGIPRTVIYEQKEKNNAEKQKAFHDDE